jgi:hypothetical protein
VGRSGSSLYRNYHYSIGNYFNFIENRTSNTVVGFVNLFERHDKPEHTDTLKTYDCPILIKQQPKKKEDSIETGTDYEHKRAKHYLT